MISAREALDRLREGNERFAAGAQTSPSTDRPRRDELVTGQAPFAIILGCSDSRVPAVLVFDQGLGDLFVIRVAGNIAAPSQIGSVEFAAGSFGTRLVVVLGHTGCGAVSATLDDWERPAGKPSHVGSILDRIRPPLEAVVKADSGLDRDALLEAAVRANIRASAEHLRHGSAFLEQRVRDDGLVVVGAEYSLETGVVEFFDGVPAPV